MKFGRVKSQLLKYIFKNIEILYNNNSLIFMKLYNFTQLKV